MQFQSSEWQQKLKLIIPTYEKSFINDEVLCNERKIRTN